MTFSTHLPLSVFRKLLVETGGLRPYIYGPPKGDVLPIVPIDILAANGQFTIKGPNWTAVVRRAEDQTLEVHVP